jgi:hypothetical protein
MKYIFSPRFNIFDSIVMSIIIIANTQNEINIGINLIIAFIFLCISVHFQEKCK